MYSPPFHQLVSLFLGSLFSPRSTVGSATFRVKMYAAAGACFSVHSGIPHGAILCGFYSRAAFIKLSVKSFVILRALRKASFYKIKKNCDAMTWFLSKPSSFISRCFDTNPYLHGTSNPFPRFLPMNSHDDGPPFLKKCQTSLDSVRCCTYRVYPFDIAIRDGLFSRAHVPEY